MKRMNLPKNPKIVGAIIAVIVVASVIAIPLIVIEIVDNMHYKSHDPIVIWGDDDFKNYDLKGRGTLNNPYVISNYNITTDYKTGISIWNTTKCFVIKNCLIQAASIGIELDSVEEGSARVENNICYGNIDTGIVIYNSPELMIVNNEISFSEYGLIIDSSPSMILSKNLCEDNSYGLIVFNSPLSLVLDSECSSNDLGMVIVYSPRTQVINSIINDNSDDGVSIYESWATKIDGCEISSNVIGVFIYDSVNSIVNNSIMVSNSFGIRIEYNRNAFIERNRFIQNAYGIYFNFQVNHSMISYNYFELNFMYSISIKANNMYNEIFHNAFINNGGIGSQAYDDDSTTYWYSFYYDSGNYWNDWGGVGNYTIDGLGGNADLYPLESSPL